MGFVEMRIVEGVWRVLMGIVKVSVVCCSGDCAGGCFIATFGGGWG